MSLESVSSSSPYNPSLRQTKSLTSKKPDGHSVPRRSYSNASLFMRTKKEEHALAADRNIPRLLRTLTDLFLNRRRRHQHETSCWHSQTYTVDLVDEDSSNHRPAKKIKCQHKPHAENWWAVSPPLQTPIAAF